MKSTWHWFIALFCMCATAQAKVQCPLLFLQEGAPNTYYALVFVDEKMSEEDRDRLRNQVNPKLNDIERDLSRRVKSTRRIRLELIPCPHRLGGSDLNPEEMKQFLGFKVVAVFWKEQEGDKPGLVQLAIPVYTRTEGAARRDAEVVTLYPAVASTEIENWIQALVLDSAIYRPFVTMGLATVYQRSGDWLLAATALCDSRLGLAALASTPTLRPNRLLLEREIDAPLGGLIKQMEQTAQSSGHPPWPACTVTPAVVR